MPDGNAYVTRREWDLFRETVNGRLKGINADIEKQNDLFRAEIQSLESHIEKHITELIESTREHSSATRKLLIATIGGMGAIVGVIFEKLWSAEDTIIELICSVRGC